MTRRTLLFSFSFVIFAGTLASAATAGPVDADWPTYGFSYSNTRHAPLTQINARNVASLEPAWRFDAQEAGEMESSPIVVGGVMYVTTAEHDSVIALDAATGAKKWIYTPTLGRFAYCCSKVNRGVAIGNGLVFVATLDGRLIALDARSGAPRWAARVGDSADGFNETAEPLAWRGMVFVGSAGGDFGIRGSYSAYRASDGALVWRWWSVGPGWEGKYTQTVHGYSLHRDVADEKSNAPRFRDAWRHGGGAVWMTPALDEARDTIYLSTGNPAPNFNAENRPGDNLFTNSIVALDARTGHMRWYYQETPHDVWDYDAASPPFLFDSAGRDGRQVPAVGEAGKTGWLYVLDRRTGEELRVSENMLSAQHMYETRGKGVMEPSATGGALGPSSYDPDVRLAFVVALERRDLRMPGPIGPRDPTRQWLAGRTRPLGYSLNYLCAVSPDTGRVVWRRHLSGGWRDRFNYGFISGSLSAGDLVFVPEPNGVLFALNARDGSVAWSYRVTQSDEDRLAARSDTASKRFRNFVQSLFQRIAVAPPPSARLDAPPIRYMVHGREYIALCADIFADGIERNVVMTFALPK